MFIWGAYVWILLPRQSAVLPLGGKMQFTEHPLSRTYADPPEDTRKMDEDDKIGKILWAEVAKTEARPLEQHRFPRVLRSTLRRIGGQPWNPSGAVGRRCIERKGDVRPAEGHQGQNKGTSFVEEKELLTVGPAEIALHTQYTYGYSGTVLPVFMFWVRGFLMCQKGSVATKRFPSNPMSQRGSQQ